MSRNDTMTAVAVTGGRGAASALHTVTVARPVPRRGQVLIAVEAAGVNRPDVLQRRGLYPPPPGAPETLGLEVAGRIAAVSEGVSRWRVGDGVCALLPGGGYAEFAVADAGSVLPIPRGLTPVQAAALPETVFTVWTNVFEAGALEPGETLMIHGATSGIGTIAIQMAKAHGCRVIATSRGEAKAVRARGIGADLSLDSTAVDFGTEAETFGGTDVILDMVGGPFLAGNLRALKPGGRLVQIATQGGTTGEIDLMLVMRKRLTVTGSTLRNRPPEEKARIAGAVEATVWPWIEAGRVRPLIDAVLPLSEAAQAHARLEAGDHLGKVVLTT